MTEWLQGVSIPWDDIKELGPEAFLVLLMALIGLGPHMLLRAIPPFPNWLAWVLCCPSVAIATGWLYLVVAEPGSVPHWWKVDPEWARRIIAAAMASTSGFITHPAFVVLAKRFERGKSTNTQHWTKDGPAIPGDSG